MLAFLTLAVHLGEGEEFLRWKTEKGDHLLKCTKWSHYSLIFRAAPSTGISCPAHPAARSETQRSQQRVTQRVVETITLVEERKKRNTDTSGFNTLT